MRVARLLRSGAYLCHRQRSHWVRVARLWATGLIRDFWFSCAIHTVTTRMQTVASQYTSRYRHQACLTFSRLLLSRTRQRTSLRFLRHLFMAIRIHHTRHAKVDTISIRVRRVVTNDAGRCRPCWCRLVLVHHRRQTRIVRSVQRVIRVIDARRVDSLHWTPRWRCFWW